MNNADISRQIERLRSTLSVLDSLADPADQLEQLVQLELDQLPMPGAGATLKRWQALSLVAEKSLPLAKLYEGHTDALAILAELSKPSHPMLAKQQGVWGVWAAESKNTKVTITPIQGNTVTIDGEKNWCSGAKTVGNGLLTAWFADGRGPQLVQVSMHQSGISINDSAWKAVGMADSASVDITFSNVTAQSVGEAGDYLSRPGFWQGGAGIAACWYGGSLGLASALRKALLDVPDAERGLFRLAALGKIDLALHSTAAVLRSAAEWIDNNPLSDASEVTLRARLSAEACAKTVLDEAGRALGAAAFCRNAYFARAAADLPVFVRQSHAERDYVALAERVLTNKERLWPL